MNIEKILLKIFNKKKYIKFKYNEIKIKNKNLYDKKIKIKLYIKKQFICKPGKHMAYS